MYRIHHTPATAASVSSRLQSRFRQSQAGQPILRWAHMTRYMPARKRPHRECRDYEGEWNGLCIDKNLEDDWLVRLNSLKCLRPISVCEGHFDQKVGSARTFPHIKLRIQDPFLSGIASYWDQLRPIISDGLHRLFNSEGTYLELELKFRFRWGRGRFPYRETLTVRVHNRHARASEEMDTVTYEWFEQSVGRIEELDGIIGDHLFHGSDG